MKEIFYKIFLLTILGIMVYIACRSAYIEGMKVGYLKGYCEVLKDVAKEIDYPEPIKCMK